MCSEETCHKFLVISNISSKETAKMKERGVQIIDQNNVQEAVSFCLVQPFYLMFDNLIKELQSANPNKKNDMIIREIENIRRQTSLQEDKTTVTLCMSPGLEYENCLLYTSPSPRDLSTSRMPSSA